MQQTILVTVQGTHRKLDLELPGDVPISELLPLLREMCNDSAEFAAEAEQASVSWMVQVATSSKPLQATLTLLENSVLDGDVLLLLAERPLLAGQASLKSEESADSSVSVDLSKRMIGVTWEKDWLS